MTTPANGRRRGTRKPPAARTPAATQEPKTGATGATSPRERRDESLESAPIQSAADAVEEVVLEVDEVVDVSTALRRNARMGSPPDDEAASAPPEASSDPRDLEPIVRGDGPDGDHYPLEYYQLLDVQEHLLEVDKELLKASECVDERKRSVQQAQKALSAAQRDVQNIQTRRDKDAAAAAELLAKLATILIRVDTSAETVQGSRHSIAADLTRDPLPPNLRIRWVARGLPIIEQSPDGRRVQVDARNVQAGRYNIDVSLVWDKPVSSN